ncbi:uncharacterized protein LOC119387101 [Rhipicephalus sanguineus]|uniref:uncharacterized protein LOC119387101 n=1 Tax=Rhipicephalus sanguineus TaxID=34632 RepID=UPI001893E58C|nr:uncharacterized protein LOC119387101 [Rhipicephalus sanguineus]
MAQHGNAGLHSTYSRLTHSAAASSSRQPLYCWAEAGAWPPRSCYRDSVRSSLHDEEMVGLRCEWERKTDRKFHQNQLRIQQERQQELADMQLHDRRHRLMQVLESEKKMLERKLTALNLAEKSTRRQQCSNLEDKVSQLPKMNKTNQ